MDYNAIGQLITSLGFPIVAAAALFWYVLKKDEETKALRESIQENTTVLEGLKELITYLVSELKGKDNE